LNKSDFHLRDNLN